MNTVDLIHSLTVGGFTLSLPEPDRLELRGPTEKLTEEQKASLSDNKDELTNLLSTCLSFEAREREAIQFSDSIGAMEALEECISFFDDLIEDAKLSGGNAHERCFLSSEMHCKRCGVTQSYLAIIHGGLSLRRDCAQCGRFLEFPSWYDEAKTDRILNDNAQKNRYYEKTNETGALTPASL